MKYSETKTFKMDSSKIIQTEQNILTKETLLQEQTKKHQGMRKLMLYSLISIPVMLITAVFCVNYQVQGSTSGYAGIYYSEYPYQGLGATLLVL